MDESNFEVQKKRSFFRSHRVLYLIFFLFLISIWGYSLMSPPTANLSMVNKQGIMIHIPPNEPLGIVAKELEDKKLVKSARALKILVTFLGASEKIPKGDYFFNKPLSTPSIAWRLARGDHGIEPIKITFKEGITNEEMANLLSQKLTAFRRDLFLSEERAKQGYLFPDTYNFFPMTTVPEIIDEMSSNFKNRISKLDVQENEHSLSDIITMASIIEKEAKGESDAELISGILWKRIGKNMLLQVDADKRTYKDIGLPSEPISNPGLSSIKASLNPKDSPYLYYLHDKDGIVHFAKTYTDHKANINKYLK